MKNLVFGLIAILFSANFSYAQDKNFEKFFSSQEFNQLKTTFSIMDSDVNKDHYGTLEHHSKRYKIYRVAVNSNSEKNFITFFTDDDGASYALAYEKIDIAKGIAEHFDEYGNLYATFIVIQSGNNYIFKINKVFSPKTTGSNKVNHRTTCISHIYQTLKKACESDEVCDTICDFDPFCHGLMLHWSVAYCLTH